MSFDAANPDAAKWAREHGAELAKGISDTTRDRIKEAIAREHETGEEAQSDIEDAIGDEARAEMIARTESMDAANEGLTQGWDQAVEEGLLTGDEQKTWIAAEDPCPECEEVDGETVPMDEDFSVGDDPPLHPNCRCTMGLVS
jgi:SPP1 gp7 family putative phage head morphogenesis protein